MLGMGGCPGAAWNVISAAGPLSQLAGVIAGFVFAGVIVLLSQPRPSTVASEQQTGSARLRALIPFFATFVAMGLNAYVFGLLAGEEPGDSCRRVWTATAVASGMLAIGTVASVCGIVLLVRAYLAREHLSNSDTRQLGYLERILTVTIRLLAVVAPALLLQRVYEFLRVWYGGDLHGVGWLWIVFGIAAVVALIIFRTVPPTVAHFDRALFFAGFCTVAYSVAGTALVGFFLGVGPAQWHTTPSFVPWTVAVLAVVLPAAAIGGYLYAIRGITRIGD
jgi:hypothetical protein